MDLLQQYGPIGVLVVAVLFLAKAIDKLVAWRKPNGQNGYSQNGSSDRLTLRDLREDIHELRDLVQAVVTKYEVLNEKVRRLEGRL